MRRGVWSGGLALLGALAASSPRAESQGHVLHVSAADPTCQGRLPCYRTIQAAITAAAAGDRVVVQPGVYAEQVSISGKNSASGAAEPDRIVIEADPGAPPDTVVLLGGGGACTNGHAIRLQRSRFVTIRGLTITGFGGQAIALQGGNNGNENIRVERSRIVGNATGNGDSCSGGITIARGNPGTLIANNLIHANGRHGIATMDADGGPHYVIGNTIHGNGWSGVHVTRSHEIFLVNNAITGNGTAPGSTGGRFGVAREAATSPRPADIHLLNNLLCGNRLGEISGPALDPTDFGNLTPTGTEGPGVIASPGCQALSTVYAHLPGADGSGSGVDDDFAPGAGSPLIDRGTDPRALGLGLDDVLEADFGGDRARPRNATGSTTPRFDIGAIEVRAPNRSPVADAGLDRTVVERTTVTLGGAGSDPDGDPLVFAWSQVSGPTVVVVGATTPAPAFTAPAVTASLPLVFKLTVSDGQATASDSVTITVVPANHPPLLDPIGSRTLSVGATLTFVVGGSDADGDPLTFSAAPLPANTSFDSTTRAFAFTPDASQVGSSDITFTVSDGRGGTASETITITVTATLRVTIISPVAGATVPAGTLLVRGTLHATTSDVGVAVNGAAAALQNGSFVALVAVTPDTTVLTATATTGGSDTATETIPVFVSAVPTPAVALRAAPASGVAPLGVAFTLSTTPDTDTVALDLEGDGTVEFRGRSLDGTTFTYTTPGLYVPAATVTDAMGHQTRGQAIVQVLDAVSLDTVLQARWSALRAALQRVDVDAAVALFARTSRDPYRDQLTALADAGALPQVAADLPAIRLLRFRERTAEYDLRAVRNGTQYSFPVVFVIDEDGVWRLWAF